MIYLATPSTPKVRDAMRSGLLGQMVTYKAGNRLVSDVAWALDNGVVKLVDGRPVTDPEWSEAKWLATLDRYRDTPGCLFAAVPDDVGNAAGTDARWQRYAPMVRDRGYRPAYVTQNGCRAIPYDAGAVFTGGDDAWKMGEPAHALVQKARALDLWTHCGRVNSLRRIRVCVRDGYDSCDGTYIARGPDTNLPKLLRYLRRATTQEVMFGGAA